jgi:hypothetical protein
MSDMIPNEVKILGFTGTIAVPSTVEQFDKMAGTAGVALENAVANVLYRSTFPKVRKAFLARVEDLTKISRKSHEESTGKKDAEGKDVTRTVYDETEGKYMKRVLASIDADTSAQLPAIFAEVLGLDECRFDPSERVAGPKKIPAMYTEAAETILKAGRGDAAAAKLTSELGIAVSATADSIARALQERERRRKAAERAKLAAEFGLPADADADDDSDDGES